MGASTKPQEPSDRAIAAVAFSCEISSPELTQATQGGTGTFEVGELGHTGAKHFGGIKGIEKCRPAPLFISAKAAVVILPAQDETDRLMKALIGNPLLNG